MRDPIRRPRREETEYVHSTPKIAWMCARWDIMAPCRPMQKRSSMLEVCRGCEKTCKPAKYRLEQPTR